MKKELIRSGRLLALFLIPLLLIPLLYTSCGSDSYAEYDGDYSMEKSADSSEVAYSEDFSYMADDGYLVSEDSEDYASEISEGEDLSDSDEENAVSLLSGTTDSADLGEDKIIRTARVILEATDFDTAVSDLYALAEQYDAYFESATVDGRTYEEIYYKNYSLRQGEFVLRVPKESFSSLTDALGQVGNVISLSSTMENITTKYVDTESRLKTYRVEEERLLAMLEQAETVEEMLLVEDKLSDVRYQIETLTTKIKTYDNKVDFATVNLSLREVEELTDTSMEEPSYWETMWTGFVDTLHEVGWWFADLFQNLVIALPALVCVAVVVFVILLVLLKKQKKNRKKREKSNADPAEKN